MIEETTVQGDAPLFTLSEPEKTQVVKNVNVERVEIKLTRGEVRCILINYLMEFPEVRKLKQEGYKFEGMHDNDEGEGEQFDQITFTYERLRL